MFSSIKYSSFALRTGLAAVFLWFGIDKFIHPAYWLNAWVPQWAISFLNSINMGGTQFIYMNGIFEALVGISLLTGVLAKLFSFLAILFLIAVVFSVGLSEVTVRDLGLIGGFMAILLWPSRLPRF